MALLNYPNEIWPNGIIPYRMRSGDFDAEQTGQILLAIMHWNTRTVIELVPHTGQDDFVEFRMAEKRCYSTIIGKKLGGGMQVIGCALDKGKGFGLGSIIHEIGHAVGLHHEQLRPDRDFYLHIDFDNTASPKKLAIRKSSFLLTSYDYGSIMHYPNNSYAIDGDKGNVFPIPDSSVEIGQREKLSFLDIQAVKLFYEIPDFSVVWQDDKHNLGSHDILLAAMTKDGERPNNVLRVNKPSDANHYAPDVGMDLHGSSVVVWEENTKNRQNYRVKAKAVWANGQTRFDEFCVHETNEGKHVQPSISVAKDGSFIVVWIQRLASEEKLLCCIFNEFGQRVSGEFPITTIINGSLGAPVIERSSNGDFVVLWGILNESLAVHVQAFNAFGEEKWSSILVANQLGSQNVVPRLALAENGDFIVVWEKNAEEIYAKAFHAVGRVKFNEFIVNADQTGPQYLADISLLPNGEFLVVWTDDSNENNMGQIYLRGFRADGSRYLPTRTVNQRGGGSQGRPRIAVGYEGEYYVVWQDDTDGNGQYQVHANCYTSDHEIQFSSQTMNQKWKGQQWKPAIATRKNYN